ncbi:MAG: acyl-phosphate glycerol 3-phosphate acyltransferase [Verrucomicrobiales bacterium]|nr:acyl-phosphate glycerol 3-phosphate acyltransferase [Verrucomicrobiales bacterium]
MDFPYKIFIISLLAAYLIGSFPFGFWIAKLKGIDIRNHGSGNIGATNVFRNLGAKFGILVLILDMAKGFIPVLLGSIIILKEIPTETLNRESIEGIIYVSLAIVTIIGHNYTLWLGFKGGKGIATSAGSIIPFLPEVLIGSVIIWIAVFFTSRYVALASIAAALSLPILTYYLDHNYLFPDINSSNPVLLFGIIAGLMAIWRHKSNIRRIISGEEEKFKKRIK